MAKNESKASSAEKNSVKRVKVKLPKLRDGSDEEVYASVNGEGFKIKRGVEVEVPDYIAEVLKHSEEAQDAADEFMQTAADKSN